MAKRPITELSTERIAKIGNKGFDEAAKKAAASNIKPVCIEYLEQEDAELAAIARERMAQPEIEVDIEDL